MSDVALTCWTRSFSSDGTIEDIFDSIFLNDVYRQIDIHSGPDEVQREGLNDVSRLKNWKLLFTSLIQFYYENLLNIVIGPLPDLEALTFHPHSAAAQETLQILQLLLLGAAVQCGNREYHIGRIKCLPLDIQMDMMKHIQNVTESGHWQLSVHLDSAEGVPSDVMLSTLLRIATERSNFHSKWLETSYLKNVQSVQTENELRKKYIQVFDELEEKNRICVEVNHQIEVQRGVLEKLKAENETLSHDASAASFYRDELDALREKLVQFDRLEKDLNKYKNAARDLDHYLQRAKELERENESLLSECSKSAELLAAADGEKRRAVRELIECRVELRESSAQLQELAERTRATREAQVQGRLRRDGLASESEVDGPSVNGDRMSLSEELQSSASSRLCDRVDGETRKNQTLFIKNLERPREMPAGGVGSNKMDYDQLHARCAELSEKLDYYERKERLSCGSQTLLDGMILKEDFSAHSPKLECKESQASTQTENITDEVDIGVSDLIKKSVASTGTHLQSSSHFSGYKSTFHRNFVGSSLDDSSHCVEASVQTGICLATSFTEADLKLLKKVLSTRWKSTGIQTETQDSVCTDAGKQKAAMEDHLIYERPITTASVYSTRRRFGSLRSPLKSWHPGSRNVSAQTNQRMVDMEELESLQKEIMKQKEYYTKLHERHQTAQRDSCDQQKVVKKLLGNFQVVERKLVEEKEVTKKYKEELDQSQRHSKVLSAQIQEAHQNQKKTMQSQVTASQIAELHKLLDSEKEIVQELNQKIETVHREKLILEDELHKSQFSNTQSKKELQAMKISFSKVESERDFHISEVNRIAEEISRFRNEPSRSNFQAAKSNRPLAEDSTKSEYRQQEPSSPLPRGNIGNEKKSQFDYWLRPSINSEDQNQSSCSNNEKIDNIENSIVMNLQQQLKAERGRLNSLENKYEFTLHEKQQLILKLRSQLHQLQEEDDQRIRQIQNLQIKLDRLKNLPYTAENWDSMMNSLGYQAKKTSNRATQIDQASTDASLLQSELDALRNEHSVLQETLLQIEKSCRQAFRFVGLSMSSFSQKSISVLVEQVATLLIDNASQLVVGPNFPRNPVKAVATPQPNNISRSSRAGSQVKSFFLRGSFGRATMPEKGVRKPQIETSDCSFGEDEASVKNRSFSDVKTLQEALNALMFTDDRLISLERENRKLKKVIKNLQHAITGVEPYDRKMYHYYTNV